MPETPHDDTLIESLLEEGLFLFGADKVQAAIRVWEKVLELSPGEPRALDYLRSAGADGGMRTLAGGTLRVESVAPPISPVSPVSPISPISRMVTPPKVVGSREFAVISEPQTLAPDLRWDADEGLRESRSTGVTTLNRSRLPLWIGLIVGGVSLAAAAIIVLGNRTDEGSASPAAAVSETPSSPAASAPAVAWPEPSAAPEVVADVKPAEPALAPAVEHYRLDLRVEPRTATIEIDGREVAVGAIVQRFEVDGTKHELTVSAPGYETETVAFIDAPPPGTIELVRSRTRSKRARRRPAAKKKSDAAKRPAAQQKPAAAKKKSAPRRTDNRDPWQ